MIEDEIRKYKEEAKKFEHRKDQYKQLLNGIIKLTEDEEDDETLSEESCKNEFDVPYNTSYGHNLLRDIAQ